MKYPPSINNYFRRLTAVLLLPIIILNYIKKKTIVEWKTVRPSFLSTRFTFVRHDTTRHDKNVVTQTDAGHYGILCWQRFVESCRGVTSRVVSYECGPSTNRTKECDKETLTELGRYVTPAVSELYNMIYRSYNVIRNRPDGSQSRVVVPRDKLWSMAVFSFALGNLITDIRLGALSSITSGSLTRASSA